MALIRPVAQGDLTDGFGPRGYVPGVGNLGTHTGQDFAAPAGEPIIAAHTGTILRKWYDRFPNGAEAGGYMVSIKGDDGIETRYAHMAGASPIIEGTRVQIGDRIGNVGRSGAANGYHLHFEAIVNGKYVDPLPLITKEEDDMSQRAENMIEDIWNELLPGKAGVKEQGSTNRAIVETNKTVKDVSAALKPGEAGVRHAGEIMKALGDISARLAAVEKKLQ